MARRSLKPQLNQIRAWVRQGRTDAWIAHQLEVSASELREFRKQHDLTPDGEDTGSQEIDLRDEIEAEVEAATVEEPPEGEEEDGDEEPEAPKEDKEDKEDKEKPRASESAKRSDSPRQSDSPRRSDSPRQSDSDEDEGSGAGGERPRRRRRRGRRGGRGRRREIEATFDHGEQDGYGLWLDASIKDNPVYAEHWAGKRKLTVRIEQDQIVIRRAGSAGGGTGQSDSDD